MSTPRLGIVTFVASGLFLGMHETIARAAECGEFVADDGDNVIVVGEWVQHYDRTILPYVGQTEIGVCWRDGGGTWRFETVPGCDLYSAPNERLHIDAGEGDDIVIPVVREDWRSDFVCPTEERIYMWPIHLWAGDYAEYPSGYGCSLPEGCPGAFEFGFEVEAGLGEDLVWGTPNDDILHGSRAPSLPGWPFLPTYYPDDAADALCGMGGSDSLYGDASDPSAAGYQQQECFDGGVDEGRGYDACYGRDDQWNVAVVDSCEATDVVAQVGDTYWAFGAGTCCGTSSEPGCAPRWADEVESCVCDLDAYCCDVAWDSLCVSEADECDGCGYLHAIETGCWQTCRHQVSPELFPGEAFVVPPLRRIVADAGLDPTYVFKPQVRS